MNLNDRSKQCPRCRFILSKTHSDKMICKRCGYTSNKLQIVAEEDQYNANIRYNKRVSFKKQSQYDPSHPQNSHQTCLKHYQHLLKHLGTQFINMNINQSIADREKTHQTFKNLWLGYLQKMSRQGNVIRATFVPLAEKAGRKNQKGVSEADKSEEDSSEESGSEKEEKEEKQEKMEPGEQEKSEEERRGKRGRKKEQDQDELMNIESTKSKASQNKDEALKEFKKIVNSTLKAFKSQTSKSPSRFRQIITKNFLSKLLSLPRPKLHECSFSSLMYLAEKYSWTLVASQMYQSRGRQSIESKLQSKYVSNEDLRKMCRDRDLQFEKRRLYTELTVLSHDLLEGWYKDAFKSSVEVIGQNEPLPYAYLLETYRSEASKPPILQSIIRSLQNMSEQTVIKMQQRQKKVPELSLKFICALVYLSCVMNKKTFTILQVINRISLLLSEYVEENRGSELVERREMMGLMVKERNVRVRRVRKMAHQLFGYVQEFVGEQALMVEKWCAKYCGMFKVPGKNAREIQVLATTLLNGYMQQIDQGLKGRAANENLKVHNTSAHRFLLIEQPEISLASVVIYLKLVFGLDRSRYPYLKSIGEIGHFMRENKQYLRDEEDVKKIEYLMGLVENQHKQLNQNCEFGLVEFVRAVNKQFRPVYSQNDIKDLSGKRLIDIATNIAQFRSMAHKKEQHRLSLISNFQQTNSVQNALPVIQVGFISQQRPKEKIPSLFRKMKQEKTLTMREEARKALDYLYDRHKRHNKSQKEQIKDKQAIPHQGDQLEEQKEFKVDQNIDKPQRHYQIVYHPTINSLSQLKYFELLVVVENLSLIANGEYTDCRDVLEWVGLLEAVLKDYEM